MIHSKTLKIIGAAFAGLLMSTPSWAQLPTYPSDMPPLSPIVTCEDSLCKISLSGVLDGNTFTSGPLTMSFSIEDSPYWQPRILSNDMLKMNSETAPYGWLIGDAEQEMEILLTPLTEVGGEDNPLLFMVEQRAGFEHVGRAYHFLNCATRTKDLKIVKTIGPGIGPQPVVTSANTQGVRVRKQQFNPETGDFIDVYEQYEWYSGADTMMLGTMEEMEAIYANEDILMNEPQ